jgi:hypothetical protein
VVGVEALEHHPAAVTLIGRPIQRVHRADVQHLVDREHLGQGGTS